jgi:hypothetical protein
MYLSLKNVLILTLGKVTHAWVLASQEVEAGGFQVQGQLSEFNHDIL